MKKNILILLLLGCSVIAFPQQKIKLSSPDGNLKFEFLLLEDAPYYQVSYKNKLLIQNSKMGFDFDSGVLASNLKLNKAKYATIDETYELVVGKTKVARNHCKEVVIPLEEKNKPFRKVNVVVRAFNDGLAFRYEFPQQSGWKSYIMYDELTGFNLTGNPKALALFLPGYISSHEGLYTYEDYNKLPENRLMDMPVTFVYPDGIHLAVTEAALVDYAGMYLVKEEDVIRGKLSPKLGQEKVKVTADLPHKTPWRVMLVSDRAGALIESDILTHLNEPCKIEDTSWIRPGKTTFTWWNGNVVPDTAFSPGNNFLTNKYYIDFAARNGLDFHSIYGYAEQPWYTDDGFNFAIPGPNADITKPIAPLDMKMICNYAKSKGVDIHVWVNWKPLYDRLDEAFALFEEWGIVGMMVDFMDRDDQEMIRIQEEILQKAARHHLFIQFHGSSKPSGLHRTYPNEFTREGTLNYEVYKWDTIVNADHDIRMPFSRLLAGAADYHLGGFRSVPRSEFKIQYTRPLVTSTRCHMLAMYVVLESYLGMVCDIPSAYEGQPGFDFLCRVPTSWDETKVPHALIDEYVTVVRRKGDEWYVGSLTNSKARTLDLSLDFLEKGTYTAEIYTDAPGTDPNLLIKQVKEVTAKEIIPLSLASEGGAVMRIYKK